MPTTQEDRGISDFQHKSQSSFKRLIKDLKSYGDQAKSEHKGQGKAIINKRKKHIGENIQSLPQVITFLDDFVGVNEISDKMLPWRNTTVNLIRDYLAGQKTLKEISESFEKNTERSFKAIETHSKQTPLKESIPVELRAFLPETITIDVDEEGYIKKINDMFGNKSFTLSEKIKTQKKLVTQYNTIAETVQKDLKSKDELKKMSALVTSIIMETGIRPGQKGNATIEIVDGQEVEVETFGAITLTPSHVKFVKKNFVELKFKGKKGTINTATISNENITSILKDYVDNALETGSDYIFVNEKGVNFSYRNLTAYFKENFKEFKVTDFRKLRATQVVFEELKKERDKMLKKIKKVSDLEAEELKQKVVEIIANTINKAHEKAQIALNHDDEVTTKKAYINPEVLLKFLSTASMEETLKDCITSGKTKLHFDPMMFVRESKKTASHKIYASGQRIDSLNNLIRFLNSVFEW